MKATIVFVRVPWTGSGYGTQGTVGSGLNAPEGVAVDAAGDVFIADSSNNRVVKEPWSGSSFVGAIYCSERTELAPTPSRWTERAMFTSRTLAIAAL